MKYERVVHYRNGSSRDFQQTLKNRVEQYFAKQGLSRFATPYMWFKVVFFVSAFIFLWSRLAFTPHTALSTLALLVLFAFSYIFLAFNVSHDAVHNALSGKAKIDHAIFYLSFNLLGPSAYLWKIRHNNAHHFFVNIPGSDMDIEGTKLLRVAPHVPWRPMHRFQHLYCVLLYSIFTLHWFFFKDFKILGLKSFGSMTELNHSKWRYLELVFWKLVYVGFMIIIPILALPYSPLAIIGTYILFNLFLSTVLLITFAMSHVAMESHFVEPSSQGNLAHSFYEHQLLTSVDYHSESKIVGFFFGGFNNHVAHHMFPGICSVHYIPLTQIIRETAKEFALPYNEKNIWELIKSHFQLMKTLGSSSQQGEQFVVRAVEG